ncbi:carboxypeptidase-like regulatory domain-containing protein [Flavimarina sp. Hel_I_48]|uniref:carboxypeptidase-like regulatory domain-containing protein n=1 Tax=Flavimarina sp. Hel_I_48 TaxID=1392488 RepID=UPI00056A871D|nr:carboxypeptidase-like regulatory domain-containing protein [Flavimarina sp. Hel_I_48]
MKSILILKLGILMPRSYRKYYFLLLLGLLITMPKGLAQDTSYTEYKGTVRDALTEDPIAFVSLTIQGTNIASLTNSDGEFSLKAPQNRPKAKVQISAVGYETLIIIISEFLPANTVIELQPQATQLAEVNVKRPSSAENLVRSVFSSRDDNYLSSESYMTAFYRETIKKRRTPVSLAEAVVNVDKKPYSRGGSDRVKLYKARKQTDYNKLDTLALKLEGGPFNALYADVIKYPEYFFTPDLISSYDFSFGPSTQIDDKLIYVVNFEQKKRITDPLYYGKLFIDAESQALTSAIYSLNLENEELAKELFVRKKPYRVDVEPVVANYRVDYREKDGKWYYGYSNIQLEFVIDWKGKLFNSRYRINSEMLITDWQKETNALALQADEKFNSRSILADEASGFSDPNFWGSYNVIEPDKSIQSAIEKIQRQLKK